MILSLLHLPNDKGILIQKKNNFLHLLVFFVIITISNVLCDANSQNNNTSTTAPAIVVCPLSLTEKLPCLCRVLSAQQSVQIVCNGTQPEQVWNALGEYRKPIDKMAIRDCPSRIEYFQSVPSFSIRSLEISNCPIASLSSDAFDSLANSLEELWLVNDSLVSVPKFNGLKKLIALNLNVNELKQVPDLSGLKQLRHLRLKRNKICSIIIPLLDQKATLELLDLSQNCFKSIPASALRGLISLKYLSLAGNAIEEIGPMQFMSLPQLIELRLQSNRLQRIVPNGFMNVPKLRILLLQSNFLSLFDPGTLEAFKELQLIDLNANRFRKIPSFKEFMELVEVRLDDNNINAIDTLAFSSNPKLMKISLANNQIATIARNSFDALEKLEFLNLADNALTTLERGMLEGMRHLKNLIVRNNSISELDSESFQPVQELVSLDLSDNELSSIKAGTFSPLQRLHLLKLNNNHLKTIEEGAFTGKVDILLLDGNELSCDNRLDWFIDWVVRNKVRTFVPDQPEIRCASPEQKRGHRLKDLMIRQNNITESLIASTLTNIPGIPGNNGEQQNSAAAAAGNLLANWLPNSGRQNGGAGAGQMGAGMLNAFTNSIPEIRKFVPQIPQTSNVLERRGGDAIISGGGIDSAIDQFSEPLVKFASGVPPSSADVGQLLSSIPSLIVNVPGFGNVDISKLNPSLVNYVVNGGQIPGIPRETLDHIVKQYMQRLYVAAAQAQGISTEKMPVALAPGTNISRMLRPISELPHGLVQNVMEGKKLPHLSTEQTKVIQEYYTQHAPIGGGSLIDKLNNNSSSAAENMSDLLPKKTLQLMKLLPNNYNLSSIHPDVIKQVIRGELPDLSKLPPDLQRHVMENIGHIISSLGNTPSISIEEFLSKLPTFEQPMLPTFSPYDINTVDSELVVKERREDEERARFWRFCAAISLGLAGAVTLGVISAFLWYWRRTRASRHGVADVSERGPGVLPSVVREQSFRPSASSTLK